MKQSNWVTVNAGALEGLKTWYALFTTLMDTETNPETLLEKLLLLRARIKAECPELEKVVDA
jgi:hypothetical protein